MLKAIHAMESRGLGGQAESVAAELESMKLRGGRQGRARGLRRDADVLRDAREHWRRIRTNNAIERLNREIRRIWAWSAPSPTASPALMLVTPA